MALSHEVIIRKYHPADRTALRRISYQTALLGHPEVFFSDPEIIEDLLTRYFTDFDSEASFVACSHGRIIGYLIGAKDEQRVNQIFLLQVLPGLLLKALSRGYFFKKTNGRFLGNLLKSFLKGEFTCRNLAKDYPAILHINLDESFRKGGVGRKLIEHYFAFLKENHVKGVHVSAMTQQAKMFFEKMGFELLSTSQRSYMKYALGKNIPNYILGKTIS